MFYSSDSDASLSLGPDASEIMEVKIERMFLLATPTAEELRTHFPSPFLMRLASHFEFSRRSLSFREQILHAKSLKWFWLRSRQHSQLEAMGNRSRWWRDRGDHKMLKHATHAGTWMVILIRDILIRGGRNAIKFPLIIKFESIPPLGLSPRP